MWRTTETVTVSVVVINSYGIDMYMYVIAGMMSKYIHQFQYQRNKTVISNKNNNYVYIIMVGGGNCI